MKKVINYISILVSGCIIVNLLIKISGNIRIRKSISERWAGLQAGKFI